MTAIGTHGTLDEHPWALLGRRLKTPVGEWSFWTVLILGIVILGYLAVWVEESHVQNFVSTASQREADLQPLRLAYATAMLAVAAPCVAQLVLAMNKIAGLVALVIAFAVATLAYRVSQTAPDLHLVHTYGVPGLLIAVASWWLANGEDPLFQDRAIPGGPSGGDPKRKLTGGASKVKT